MSEQRPRKPTVDLSTKKSFLLVFSLLLLSSPSFSRSLIRREPQDSKHFFCGTYRDRVKDELRKYEDLRKVIEARASRQAQVVVSGATQDIDDIAVIEDDGSIVVPRIPFDLSFQALRLSAEAAGSYRLSKTQSQLGIDFGTKLTLTDDDFKEIVFQGTFRFPFFGKTYSSLFINSDGNVTFGGGDAEHTARDLGRFNGGAPRIGAFFADWDPSGATGGIFYKQLDDRFVITWNRIREFGGFEPSTFQLALFADGSFEFVYGEVSARSGIVGWSGGGNSQIISLVDFSLSVGTAFSGPKAERFSPNTDIEQSALTKKFFQTHPDDYDQLIMFSNFEFDLGDAFAFEANIKNQIQGIGLERVDSSSQFGSAGRLQSLLVMNQLAEFPDDPDTVFLGTNSTIDILGQEAGHRWLAFVKFREGTNNSSNLLGRDQAHWSFFFNSDASVMEGNLIEDRGAGSFRTTEATDRYSKLDQYIMGLREPSEVGSLFYVGNPTGTSRKPDSSPAVGVSFGGIRKNLTVDDVIAAEGPRVPSAALSPKVFRQAFILLVRQGTIPSNADLDKISRIRRRWQEFFSQATDGLGSVDTTVTAIPLVPSVSSLTPASGPTLGNTPVYISGSNFQKGVKVSFGSAPATAVKVSSPSLLNATAPPGSEGVVSLTVENPNAVASILPNAYNYRVLAQTTISANALRLAGAVDSPFFRSNLGINNPNPVSANIRILHLDRNGLLVNQSGLLAVPPNGFVQINSILRYIEGVSTVTGREGSLVLESDQTIQAFISQIDNQTGDPSILEGIRGGSSRLILQSSANTGPFRSTLLVLNLASGANSISITALDRSTGLPLGTPIQNLIVAPNGFVTFENILASLSVSDNFGPIEIRSTSGAPLGAFSKVSGLNAGTSGFFPAQESDSGLQTQIVPFVIDTDAFRTNLGINNFGNGTASVNIGLIEHDGSTLASTTSPIQVAPQGLVQVNNIVRYLLTGSSSSPVTQKQGYLSITSNSPIRAFATQIDNQTNDPSIEISVGSGSGNLLLKSSANGSFQSTLAVVNPNSSPISISLTAREGRVTNNGTISGTKVINIPANGYFSTDNVLQEIGTTSVFGPIEIRSISGSPIIAVSRVYNTAGKTSGFFSTEAIP